MVLNPYVFNLTGQLESKPPEFPTLAATDSPTTSQGSSMAFLAKKNSKQEFRRPPQNHLTSINSEIDRRNNGNVLIAQELSEALQAKICWGILTP